MVSNSEQSSVEDFLHDVSKFCDEVKFAVAYCSQVDIILRWLKKKVKVLGIVALQYPTNPRALRKLLPHPSWVEIKFYDSRFHSKFCIFTKHNRPIGALVGSSNLTNGGLSLNIETNIYIADNDYLAELTQHFKEIWENAALLSPEDVENYALNYNRVKRDQDKAKAKQKKYERRYVKPRFGVRPRVIKEGLDYYKFWKCVDDVKNIVGNISAKEWPRIPVYLAVDHFFHWVVKVWDRKKIRLISTNLSFRKRMLPVLFRQYIRWDRSEQNWTKQLYSHSRYFYSLLNQKAIKHLLKSDARDIYSELYSGHMRTRRFSANDLFVKDNPIVKIRRSFEYLLWSSDDVARRISALLKDPRYKLRHFGSSNTQELLGWVHPKMPIRNEKANKAIEMLGYKFR